MMVAGSAGAAGTKRRLRPSSDASPAKRWLVEGCEGDESDEGAADDGGDETDDELRDL